MDSSVFVGEGEGGTWAELWDELPDDVRRMARTNSQQSTSISISHADKRSTQIKAVCWVMAEGATYIILIFTVAALAAAQLLILSWIAALWVQCQLLCATERVLGFAFTPLDGEAVEVRSPSESKTDGKESVSEDKEVGKEPSHASQKEGPAGDNGSRSETYTISIDEHGAEASAPVTEQRRECSELTPPSNNSSGKDVDAHDSQKAKHFTDLASSEGSLEWVNPKSTQVQTWNENRSSTKEVKSETKTPEDAVSEISSFFGTLKQQKEHTWSSLAISATPARFESPEKKSTSSDQTTSSSFPRSARGRALGASRGQRGRGRSWPGVRGSSGRGAPSSANHTFRGRVLPQTGNLPATQRDGLRGGSTYPRGTRGYYASLWKRAHDERGLGPEPPHLRAQRQSRERSEQEEEEQAASFQEASIQSGASSQGKDSFIPDFGPNTGETGLDPEDVKAEAVRDEHSQGAASSALVQSRATENLSPGNLLVGSSSAETTVHHSPQTVLSAHGGSQESSSKPRMAGQAEITPETSNEKPNPQVLEAVAGDLGIYRKGGQLDLSGMLDRSHELFKSISRRTGHTWITRQPSSEPQGSLDVPTWDGTSGSSLHTALSQQSGILSDQSEPSKAAAEKQTKGKGAGSFRKETSTKAEDDLIDLNAAGSDHGDSESDHDESDEGSEHQGSIPDKMVGEAGQIAPGDLQMSNDEDCVGQKEGSGCNQTQAEERGNKDDSSKSQAEDDDERYGTVKDEELSEEDKAAKAIYVSCLKAKGLYEHAIRFLKAGSAGNDTSLEAFKQEAADKLERSTKYYRFKKEQLKRHFAPQDVPAGDMAKLSEYSDDEIADFWAAALA